MLGNKFLNVQQLPEAAEEWSKDARIRLTDKFLYRNYERENQQEISWEKRFQSPGANFRKPKSEDGDEFTHLCFDEYQKQTLEGVLFQAN